MICSLCRKEIIKELERYVHLEDYDKGEFVKEIWAHLNCFNKGMNRELNDLQKQAKGMLEKAGQIFQSDQFNEMFPKKEEEYIIR